MDNFSENEEKNIIKMCKLIDDRSLCDTSSNILYYIAGFVVRSLSKKLNCIECLNLLFEKSINNDHSYFRQHMSYASFTKFVSKGGLIFASVSVYIIIEYVEKTFRFYVAQKDWFKLRMTDLIVHEVISYFSDLG